MSAKLWKRHKRTYAVAMPGFALGSRSASDPNEPIGHGELPLDPGIEPYVRILQSHGVETCESCEGGKGHSFDEPTIQFHGGQAEGFRALGIALQNGLPVSDLLRFWSIQDDEPVGPLWRMTFIGKARP